MMSPVFSPADRRSSSRASFSVCKSSICTDKSNYEIGKQSSVKLTLICKCFTIATDQTKLATVRISRSYRGKIGLFQNGLNNNHQGLTPSASRVSSTKLLSVN